MAGGSSVNPKRLAQALNTISMGFAEAAEALNDSAVAAPAGPAAVSSPPTAPASSPSRAPQPSLVDESTDFAPQGSLEVCPKHHVAYTPGNYGPYCKQQTDDPAWGKQKGDAMWCRITPKNAAEYLRIKAAA
jgi:hypothetical protein